MRLQFLAFLMVFSASCIGEEIPPEILENLKVAIPNAEFGNYSHGDLNKDGKPDAAVIVYRKSEEGINESIVVLMNTNDSYQVTVRSKEWADHERRADSLGIGKGTLFLELEGSSSCCSRYRQEIKFIMRNNVFVLAGEENFEGGPSTDEYPDGWSSSESINYLSGKIIRSSDKGQKRKEITSTFKEALLPFSEFSYYTYRENFKNKELRGY